MQPILVLQILASVIRALGETNTSKIPNIYSGCTTSKGCIGNTKNCINDRSCSLVVTYKDDSKVFTFEMLGPLKHGQGYVALGLSGDASMGGDLVIECVSQISEISVSPVGVFQSYNSESRKNKRIPGTECTGTTFNKGLMNCTVITSNSQLYCKFQREQSISHGEIKFDLIHHRLYVVIASGPKLSATNIEKHTATFVSDHPIEFTKHDGSTIPSSVRMKRSAHGILMVLCFIIFVPNGVFISRYFKESFTKVIILDRKLWFSVHVSCMSVAYLLFLIAIVLMLTTQQEVNKGWPTLDSGDAHAKFGGVVVLCFTIQVVSGWYRPIGQKGYRIYSMFHSILGTTSYALALRNIALSFYLGMPCEIKWLTVGAVAWLLLWHLIMTIHFYWLDSNLGLKKCRGLRPWPIRMVLFEDAPGSTQRLRIAIIHCIGSVLIAVGMILDYVVRPGTCRCTEDYCRKSHHII